jgi:3-hydroxyisobutyrate dehydrogenase
VFLYFQGEKGPIGFVGLGNMGNHMARNLIKNGYRVVTYDVTDAPLNVAKNDGKNLINFHFSKEMFLVE